ncbi:unnamed protein product [Wickerhamomyces anomalus]
MTKEMFTNEQVDQFDKEGCICIPDYLSEEDISKLLNYTHKLIDEFDTSSHPLTKFTTGDNDNEGHVGDDYFLNSSDKISFFMEPGAFNERNELTKPKDKAINKIGHGLHLDPRLVGKFQVTKMELFLFTKPQSAIGFWIALEDCDENNGCLSYLPGSHKLVPIRKRFVKKEGGGTGFIYFNEEQRDEYDNDEKDYVKIKCRKGSLILIHNSVLHRSNLNFSDSSRYAYAFHVIDGAAEYDELNWLQVPPSGGANFTKLEL